VSVRHARGKSVVGHGVHGTSGGHAGKDRHSG
jgi:hypothetical protein